MGDTNVDIAVRWVQAGQDVPAKVVTGLDGIKAAAGRAAPEIGDRMAQAFARLEAREPTMVMRRARMAIEEMAMSAVGASGPVGRFAASLALLGGPTALAAVAGFAALGLEVKTLAGMTDELEKSLLKANTAFAQMAGGTAAARASLAALTAQRDKATEDLQSVPFLDRIKLVLTGGAGSDDYVQQRLSEGATLSNEIALQMAQIHRSHGEIIRRHGEQLRHDELKRIGGESPERALHDLLANRERFRAMGAEAAAEWAKAWLDTLHSMGLTPTARNPLRPGASAGVLGAGAELPRLRTFDFAGPAEAFLAAHAPLSALGFNPDPTLRLHGLTNQPIGSDRPGEAADKNAERNAERMAAVIGREIGPLIAMVAGIGRGSGGQAAVAGLGAVAGTLGDLRNVKGMAMLGHAAPWLSLAGGVLGGISSLFGGQKPKVIITAFEEEAARQIKELRGEPATTQIILLGPANVRQTQQQLARLARMGVLVRLPG